MKNTPKRRNRELAIMIGGEALHVPRSKGLDWSVLRDGIKRRKWFVLSVTLLTSVITLIVSLLLPSQYSVKAIISLIPETQAKDSRSMRQSGSDRNLNTSISNRSNFSNDLYIGFLKSRIVADAIIRRFELQRVYKSENMSDARDNLARASELKPEGDDRISISVRDGDKSRAASIVAAYVGEMQNLIQGFAVDQASQIVSSCETGLAQAKLALIAAQVNIVKNKGADTGSLKSTDAAGEVRYRDELYQRWSNQCSEAQLHKQSIERTPVLRILTSALQVRQSFPPTAWLVFSAALCGFLLACFSVMIVQWRHWMDSDPLRWAQLETFRRALMGG